MNTIEEDNKIVMKHTLKKINLGKNIRKIRLQRQMTRKEVMFLISYKDHRLTF